tara:strand:+ start:4908 stop:5297 length:390 start_codon:yes stop_codon:yes gene_type:complete
VILKRKIHKSSRSLRVSEVIRKAISAVFVKNELPIDKSFKFPINVTKVEMNSDLKIAYIYVTTHEEVDQKVIIEKLNSCKHYLSNQVTSRISLKFAPKLIFRNDQNINDLLNFEKLLSSEKILKDINKK